MTELTVSLHRSPENKVCLQMFQSYSISEAHWERSALLVEAQKRMEGNFYLLKVTYFKRRQENWYQSLTISPQTASNKQKGSTKRPALGHFTLASCWSPLSMQPWLVPHPSHRAEQHPCSCSSSGGGCQSLPLPITFWGTSALLEINK